MNKIKNKKADSLVGIVIWIFILSFILIWMISVLWYSKDISFNYENKIERNLLETNSKNIISRLDTSILDKQEEFYILKDTTNKEFHIMTWSINEKYAYIDRLWNFTNSWAEWKIFERRYFNRLDILRHVIYPPEIDNLVFHFDANNVDWDWDKTNEPNDWDEVDNWKDLSGNNLDAIWYDDAQIIGTNEKPIYKKDWINNKPIIIFEWDKAFAIENNWLINDDWDDDTNILYTEKSLAIVLRTGEDIDNPQTIYEEWWGRRWYSFVVHNNHIYAGIWNNQEWDDDHKYKNVDLWEVLPETVYFITVVQDSTHIDENSEYIDSQNKLQIYLNGYLVSEQEHVDPQIEHPNYIWLGAINDDTVRASDNSSVNWFDQYDFSEHFDWGIWEFIARNHALTKEEVIWVQNYFVDKWLGWVESVRYNLIDTEIEQIK